MIPTRPRHASRPRRAFTLIEATVAITVVAALGSVSSAVIFSAVKSYKDGTVRAQIHAEESASFDRITRALWSIGRDSSVSVVAPLVSSVSTSSISFNSNWSLTLTGTSLMLTESGGTAASILSNVSSFTVTAYDESNASLTLPLSGASTQAVRRLQIQATCTRQGVSETLRTKVFLRCTMSGEKTGT